MIHSIYLLLLGQGAAAPDAVRARGGEGWRPRRIKRETIHPRGKTLRELFEPVPIIRQPLPEPVAIPEVAAASSQSVPVEQFAPDITPLIKGLESLQSAIEVRAIALVIEDDDAEVLMVLQ